ncbi:MAG TPA: RsmB/NOP family class I SAM-dependent RNA methyltransferase [Verrucomicrobiales bacterium]|nr:RsmB/NOP family class I SAM-dependent RNA methyltransferase [Verrucomicrobiales bacterium]
MTAVSTNLLRLSRQLFPDDETERAAFVAAVTVPRPYQPAVMWMQERPDPLPFAVAERPAWLPEFVDIAAAGERPGQQALHESGAYYCLDVSSVFAASVLQAVPQNPEVIVDVCASPGGKSLFAWRCLRPALLISNEVIVKRTAPLISNLKRCGVHPSMVTNADPAVLSRVCPASVDVVIVDAPCSGQSLVARGQDVPGCFHPSTINLNANRQRRILANAASVVAPGGWLAYITCTYSEKENEGNVRWLLKQFRDFSPVTVPALEGHRSALLDAPCYRLWPQSGAGAGAFAALFRKAEDGTRGGIEGLRSAWRSYAVSA